MLISIFKKIAIVATFVFIAAVIASVIVAVLDGLGIETNYEEVTMPFAVGGGAIALGTGLAALTLTKIGK